MKIFVLSTWNADGKGSPEEVDSILFQHLNSNKRFGESARHIICVQQAELPSSDKELKNFKWICAGKFGSAVLINKESDLQVGCFEQVCEQICVAEVEVNPGVVIQVISCYIPPSTDYNSKDLWSKLVAVLKDISAKNGYVLAGDFNAEIAKEDVCNPETDIGIIGTKLFHKISNDNGKQLKKLVYDFHATIASTFGEIRSNNSTFYTYKDGGERSQRSYIITSCAQNPVPTKILMQDCKLSWFKDYKSALISKRLHFLQEKVTLLDSAPITVSSWNVQGASPSTVDKALNDLELPAVCVQDIFLTSVDDVKTDNYTWYTSKKLWGKNIGILIRSCSNASMDEFEVVTENLCVGNITMNGRQIKLISCSLPSHTDLVRFQEVSVKLLDLAKNIPQETDFIIAGDFNTHVTYTAVFDTLLFKEEDENGLFLQKLLKECRMEMPYFQKTSSTHVSEKVRRSSTFILMSPSLMLKYSHKRTVRWIPLFENAVVTLFFPETDIVVNRIKLSGRPPSHQVESSEPEDKNSWTVECIDGLKYVTSMFCRMKRYFSFGTTDQQAFNFSSPEVFAKQKLEEKSDLSDEIVNKYKNSPPPLDELLSILGNGFTLYFGFLQENAVCKGYAHILTASFECLNRGVLDMECINVRDETINQPLKRIVKFRWNGIVVYQYEGGKFTNFKRLMNRGQTEFVGILGQHYFTVRAKSSFYNNGLPPICQDKEELNKVVKVIKINHLPRRLNINDLKMRVNDFFREKPHHELVFGPDFYFYFESLKKYALGRNLGVRVYKSRKDLDHFDHMSIFVYPNPLELCKMLVTAPEHQDLRFQLIPPSGTDKDYFEWITQWADKIIPDEYFKPYEKRILELQSNTLQRSGSSVRKVAEKSIDQPVKNNNGKPSDLQDATEGLTSKKRSTGFIHKDVRKTGRSRVYKITKCYSFISGSGTVSLPKCKKDWAKVARELTDLPQEIVDKYRETPLPNQDLRRILGDNFVLYYGFNRASGVVSTTQDILAESFEALDRGGIMAENIEMFLNNVHHSRIVKFKWNGICIHKEEGKVKEGFKDICYKGRQALIDQLGQHFYTVKAKISYYSETLPLCSDNEKLSQVFRMVEKSEVPEYSEDNLDEIQKFVMESLSKDPDVELVFGPEFGLNKYLDAIRKFLYDNEVGYRLMKSAVDLSSDIVSLFKKRNPMEIRERLMQIPDHQDLKFFLVPPCEFYNKSHQEWIKSWAAENYIEEFKLIVDLEDKTPKPSTVKKNNQISKKSTVSENYKREQATSLRASGRAQKLTRKSVLQNRTRLQAISRRENSRLQPVKRSALQSRRSRQAVGTRENLPQQPTRRSALQNRRRIQAVSPRGNLPKRTRRSVLQNRDRPREISRRENTRMQPYRRSGPTDVWQRADYGTEYSRAQPSSSVQNDQVWREDDYSREYSRSKLFSSGPNDVWQKADYSAEYSSPQLSRSADQLWGQADYGENSRFQTSNNPVWLPANYGGEQSISQFTSSVEQNLQPWNAYYGSDHVSQLPITATQNMSNWFGNQDATPQPGQKRGWQEMDQYGESSYSQPSRSADRYVPERKRAREQTSTRSRVQTPRWDDVGPLLIVWPVTTRSEEEKDPRKILEANFPLEISLEANNRVAVHVTLPLRNGRDKKYCLCIENFVDNATKTALDMIVKRSTIIKYTVNFLPPNGGVPNFIRYNVPCQTNPRTYITLTWMDTGALDKEKIEELFGSFKFSLNEDLFFDKNHYSHEMKQMLLDMAPKHGLKVRHFGEHQRLVDRYVCVYKTKPKEEVLEEVLKMRDMHPKYRLVVNKLPPGVGFNIF